MGTRKPRQDQQRAELARARQLFRELPEGYARHEIICDEDGRPRDYRFIEVNPAFERLTGLKAGEIIGKTVLEVLPRTESYWIETYGQVALSGIPVRFENYSVEFQRFFEVTAYAPSPRQFVTLFVDVTERQRSQAALRESEERYQRITAGLTDYLYTVRVQDGRTVETVHSQACEVVTGYTKEEFAADPYLWLRMIVAEDRAQVVERIAQILRGEKIPPIVHRIVRKDGEVRWVSDTTIVHRDDQGTLVSYDGVINDITTRKQAEEKLRETQEERLELERRLLHAQKLESLGVLAGGIAHDFNNLLMAMLGNLEIALLRLSPLSIARRNIEQAVNAAERAADLTRQMLAYSGKGRFLVRELDLSVLVRENAHLLKASIAKTVNLNLQLSKDIPPITADAAQIQQVVMNLITNASEALGEKEGVVTLSTSLRECDADCLLRSRIEEKPPPGRFTCLEVTDHGCGMDEETQQRLFDPFFSTKFTGRGLGMSAVLGIVKGHKGAILVDSAPGKGTTIQVLFPVAAENTAPAPKNERAARSDPAGSRTFRGTVLVADDEDLVRSACSTMLRQFGLEVLTARDGAEAVQVFRNHPGEIAAVLLDLTMPRLGGDATYQELRRFRPGVRVILTSGFSEQEMSERFGNRELAGFIQKPFGLMRLFEELKRVLPAEPAAPAG